MKAALITALALCLGALVPVHASPAASTGEARRYTVVHLQKPDTESAAEVFRNVIPEPLLRAAPVEGVKAEKSQSRILYGQQAEDCQFPHQVALITNFGTFCGGSLIHPRWVLTAAHCVFDNSQWIQVRAGSNNWATAPVQVYATRGFQHGDYNVTYLVNDVTLLDVGEDLPVNDCIKPVELETEGCGEDTLTGELAEVSGWGTTRSSGINIENLLRYVDTEIVTNDYCRSFYGPITVQDTTTCSASPVGNKGTLCNGDSGGPLMQKATGRQIGINSFIARSGCEVGWPSGYIRVPCFVDWIREVQTL